MSHTPATGRHSVPAWPAGCVQAVLLPSQTSAVQIWPSSGHAVPADFTASAGQLLLTPLQFSATSQTPAAPRHWAVLLASAGHEALRPVQLSARSHTPADGRQLVP